MMFVFCLYVVSIICMLSILCLCVVLIVCVFVHNYVLMLSVFRPYVFVFCLYFVCMYFVCVLSECCPCCVHIGLHVIYILCPLSIVLAMSIVSA